MSRDVSENYAIHMWWKVHLLDLKKSLVRALIAIGFFKTNRCCLATDRCPVIITMIHVSCYFLWFCSLSTRNPKARSSLVQYIDLGKPKSVASVIYLAVVNNYTVIQHVRQILDDFVVSAVSSQNCTRKYAKSQVLFLPTASQSFFRP